jgi:uncharacterized circularly permuted ATP-grasp superfamily protein
MGGLLDGYPRGPAYDEMFGADGLPHAHMRTLYDALQTLTGEDLAQRAAARDRSFRDQGVTFSHAGVGDRCRYGSGRCRQVPLLHAVAVAGLQGERAGVPKGSGAQAQA